MPRDAVLEARIRKRKSRPRRFFIGLKSLFRLNPNRDFLDLTKLPSFFRSRSNTTKATETTDRRDSIPYFTATPRAPTSDGQTSHLDEPTFATFTATPSPEERFRKESIASTIQPVPNHTPFIYQFGAPQVPDLPASAILNPTKFNPGAEILMYIAPTTTSPERWVLIETFLNELQVWYSDLWTGARSDRERLGAELDAFEEALRRFHVTLEEDGIGGMVREFVAGVRLKVGGMMESLERGESKL